jgi:Ser/Thr protein kinase RdoA (MazF antagonist)
MSLSPIHIAAAQFGTGEPTVTQLGNGLINKTYKVEFANELDPPIVLQQINISTFSEPENIIHNYLLLSDYLKDNSHKLLAPMVKTLDGHWYWRDEQHNFWRATQYINGSGTVLFPKTADEARMTANCYGIFTRSLAELDTSRLKVIIPGFHDLSLRYTQFEQAITKASIQRLLKSTHVIAELRQRKKLVDFYITVTANPAVYKTRVMHHDCKMSNILLDEHTHHAICPIDLDTVMPGYFFSDLGDMIRSMAVTVDENSTQWEDIDVRSDFYKAIVTGYLAGMGDVFTKEEQEHIHYAGLLLTYMQSLRFVTDFLNNDTYYQTTYPEQNLNRALNQLILLEKLEEFLEG